MAELSGRLIEILIVDDHALFRESVARLLAAEPGIKVIAHCGSVHDALAILRSATIDLVLLDFDLGSDDARGFMRAVEREGFSAKVLVVTARIDHYQAAELIRSGVSGIFMKHSSAASLAESIRDVVAGKGWFDGQLLKAAMSVEELSGKTEPEHFTQRERQVLASVFEGLSNKEIAGRIGVSESSVKATLQQLFSKTGVRSRSQLVRIVLEQHRAEF